MVNRKLLENHYAPLSDTARFSSEPVGTRDLRTQYRFSAVPMLFGMVSFYLEQFTFGNGYVSNN